MPVGSRLLFVSVRSTILLYISTCYILVLVSVRLFIV
nr:MAG TPA: hypothetical protein [Caudoviricetes sp.]